MTSNLETPPLTDEEWAVKELHLANDLVDALRDAPPGICITALISVLSVKIAVRETDAEFERLLADALQGLDAAAREYREDVISLRHPKH